MCLSHHLHLSVASPVGIRITCGAGQHNGAPPPHMHSYYTEAREQPGWRVPASPMGLQEHQTSPVARRRSELAGERLGDAGVPMYTSLVVVSLDMIFDLEASVLPAGSCSPA